MKVGLSLPITGPFAWTGRQIESAVRLYMQQNGTTVAGKKIELIVKDDAGTAHTTRRLAPELVVNDKVQLLPGFGLTPTAFATAPIATQAKVPMIVMAAATSAITEQSPFIVRPGFTPAAGDDADGRLGGQERSQEICDTRHGLWCARWRKSTGNSTTSSSRRSPQSRIRARSRVASGLGNPLCVDAAQTATLRAR